MSNERKTSKRFSLLLLDNPALDSELISFLLTMTRKEQQELLSSWAREGYSRLKRKKRTKTPKSSVKVPQQEALIPPPKSANEDPITMRKTGVSHPDAPPVEKRPALDMPAFVADSSVDDGELPEMDFDEFEDDEDEDAQSDYNKLDRLMGGGF